MAAEAFPDKLKRLVAEKGTSIARLYDRAEWDGEGEKPSKAQLDKAMIGLRPIRPEVMEMLAAALDVAPEEFAEYRLALARAALDERVVGLDDALGMLSQLEAALQSRAATAARRGAPPSSEEQKRAREGRRGRRSQGGG